MATGKAQHYNAHKRYLLTLEMKHVLCMSPEELAEAELEEEAPEEGAGGVSESEAASNDSHDDRDDDSEGDGGTTSDCEEGRRRFDGDDMDEESLAIAREMRDDHHQFDELESSGESGDGPFGEASSELQHVPDESELIPGDTVVSLIAIPAPWEPWEQELSELECDLEQLGGPDFDLDIDPHDGLSALRPAMSRSERSCLMHGNATTHEDAGCVHAIDFQCVRSQSVVCYLLGVVHVLFASPVPAMCTGSRPSAPASASRTWAARRCARSAAACLPCASSQ